MKTNYPKCMEDTPSECRFVEGTRNATSMHSPIVRSHQVVFFINLRKKV